jgi:hypothetical protein
MDISTSRVNTNTPSPSSPSPSSTPSGLPYANPADTSPYLPCLPGAFLCVSATTFLTCDQSNTGYQWQYPRAVAAGMQCIPSLVPLPAGLGQQPGSPAGQTRSDQYDRARPFGGCATDGSIQCVRDGSGWQICDHGGWVDMGGVPAGEQCVDGMFVLA